MIADGESQDPSPIIPVDPVSIPRQSRPEAVEPSWRDYREPTLPVLLQSALECFVENGFHGTTIRVLAARANLSVPGLYHYFPTKHAIMVEIMRRAMADLFTRSQRALSEAGAAVAEQLRLHIQCLVLFHAHRSDLAFIAANEIRSLEPKARAEHITARDRQQRILDGIVSRGVADGTFRTQCPVETSRALVTMCTGVSQWFKQDGALTPEQLADRYVAIALSALGVDPSDGTENRNTGGANPSLVSKRSM